MMPGIYMSNFPGQRFALNPATKTWTLTMPMPSTTPLPLFAGEFDTGKFVKAILLNKEKTLGKQIYASSGYLTPIEIVEIFKEVFPEAGKGAEFVESKGEEFEATFAQYGTPEVASEDLGQMMQFFGKFGYFGGASLDESLITEEPLTGWREYAARAAAFKGLS
jgi:hypothetical protein